MAGARGPSSSAAGERADMRRRRRAASRRRRRRSRCRVARWLASARRCGRARRRASRAVARASCARHPYFAVREVVAAPPRPARAADDVRAARRHRRPGSSIWDVDVDGAPTRRLRERPWVRSATRAPRAARPRRGPRAREPAGRDRRGRRRGSRASTTWRRTAASSRRSAAGRPRDLPYVTGLTRADLDRRRRDSGRAPCAARSRCCASRSGSRRSGRSPRCTSTASAA